MLEINKGNGTLVCPTTILVFTRTSFLCFILFLFFVFLPWSAFVGPKWLHLILYLKQVFSQVASLKIIYFINGLLVTTSPTIVVTVSGNPDPISLSVREDEATGAQTASCSVRHSCPPHPPVLKWNQPGEELVQTQALEGGQFMVTSRLTFHPTRADHNKSLRCSVEYHKGPRQQAEAVIQVKREEI